jgi:hypothetical protein
MLCVELMNLNGSGAVKLPDFIEAHAVKINHEAFGSALNELEAMINRGSTEGELQRHLEAHPYILSQQFSHCHHVFPKFALGVQYETDFMCLDIPSSGKEWVAVEIEAPEKKVITKKGRRTADLEHAIQQIRDWRTWITDNLNYARQSKERNGLGLEEIVPRFFGYVIIGRRKDQNDKFNEIRRQLLREELITVRSWDGIIEYARKRAQILSMPLEAMALQKKQQDLIAKIEERNRLAGLVAEVRHTKELLAARDETLALLNEQYLAGLRDWGAALPDSLLQKVSDLLATNTPIAAIMTSLKECIPEGVPEVLLGDFISQIMGRKNGNEGST